MSNLPAPDSLQDLAQRPQVISDIRQHLRIRRRQEKQWNETNLFTSDLDELRPKKNDHPMVQIAKRLAMEFAKADANARVGILKELASLAQGFDRTLSKHNETMMRALLEAAKLDVKLKTEGSSQPIRNMTRDEWIEELMEKDGMSREAAEAVIDQAISAEAKSADADAGNEDDE